MALFRRTRHPKSRPVDTAEIELAKLENAITAKQVEQRARSVSQTTGWLEYRRNKNHFGDLLDISWTPRHRRAS